MVRAFFAVVLLLVAFPSSSFAELADNQTEDGAAALEGEDVLEGGLLGEEVPEDESGLSDDFLVGPRDLDLGFDISIALPEGFAFLPKEPATQALESMGNFGNEDLLGLIVSEDEEATYFVVVEYFDPGWVDDDEALDADDLMSALQQSQREGNKVREANGFEALSLDGWAEKPYYDHGLHHLVWGLTVTDSTGSSINYSTRILGRRGFVSLNLVADPETIVNDKAAVQALLKATSFSSGARYEDYDSSTDRSSGLGIGALVAGGAIAAKVGIFAKIGKLLLVLILALKKGFILVLVGVGAFFKKIFGGNKDSEIVTSQTANDFENSSDDDPMG